MPSIGSEAFKDNVLPSKLSSKEEIDSKSKNEAGHIADNRQESTGIWTSRQGEHIVNRTTVNTNTEAHASTGSIEHRSSEAKMQYGPSRSDGRSDNKRIGERNSTSGNNSRPSNDHHSSVASKYQDRTSNGHRNDRNRSQMSNGGKDQKDRAEARERPTGGGREGGKDGANHIEGRLRAQDQRPKDNRQQSQPFRHNQGRDNANDPEHKGKDTQQHERQSNVGNETRPDPLSLMSITGRMGSLTPQRPFFGNSRIVDDFEKLNKVGEGTYGVV